VKERDKREKDAPMSGSRQSTGTISITEEDILCHLKKVALDELELKPEEVETLGLETPIVEGLRLDSVTQVVLMTEIEEYYGLEFEPEDRDRLETLADIVAFIKERATRRGAYADPA